MARRGDACAMELAPILGRGDPSAGGLVDNGGVAGAGGRTEEEAGGEGGGGAKRAVGREEREGDVRAGVQRRLRDIRWALVSAASRF